MARARLVSKKISDSERVNALPGDGALLYTWMILHTDREGRMKALPILIKNKVFPLRKISLKQIEHYLTCMTNSKKDGLGLIERYEVEGKKYLYMPGFDSEQSNKGGSAWKSREAPSEIPPPPDWIPPSDETLGDSEGPNPKKPSDPDILTSGMKVDEKLAEVAKCYEDNIGPLTPMIAEEIKDLYKTYGLNRCMDAFKEAAKYRKHSIAYITAILEGRGAKKPNKVTGKENPLSKLVTE